MPERTSVLFLGSETNSISSCSEMETLSVFNRQEGKMHSKILSGGCKLSDKVNESQKGCKQWAHYPFKAAV